MLVSLAARQDGSRSPVYNRHRDSRKASREPRALHQSECLGKLVLLGENLLRTSVREYVAHHHTERNHQGLEGRLISPPANLNRSGPIACRERLGGLLRFYHRQAA
jgi:hypothetical protein